MIRIETHKNKEYTKNPIVIKKGTLFSFYSKLQLTVEKSNNCMRCSTKKLGLILIF
jgi:hypothetical protein